MLMRSDAGTSFKGIGMTVREFLWAGDVLPKRAGMFCMSSKRVLVDHLAAEYEVVQEWRRDVIGTFDGLDSVVSDCKNEEEAE